MTSHKTTLICMLWALCALALGCRPPEPVVEKTTGGEAPKGPQVVGQEVTYQAGDITAKGYIAWDSARTGPRPGIVVVHEWWGHNDYVRQRAAMLAELGYTALAIDMFGDGKNTQHPADAQAFVKAALADPAMATARFNAGLELLKAHETTDPERMAAIGYCFGGAVVLNMARQGADLDLVGSFHGSLEAMAPAEPGAVAARLLVMTGEADPLVPAERVEAFRQEMEQAGAVYEIVSYPGAKHAFTNPGATAVGQANNLPLAYDPAADADSWSRFTQLAAATFAAPEPTAEAKKAAAEAAKARGELARMEAEASTEAARWTPEMHAAAKKLAETRFRNTKAALKKILASPHRTPGNPERDVYRHPTETLGFMGIKPGMKVFEYGPGAGWYTELLAPLLAARGKLIVNNGDPNGPPENRGTFYARRFQRFLDKAPELYGKVQQVRVENPASPALGLDGSLDMVLLIRGYHGLKNRDQAKPWLAEFHRALKPGGTLGIVQHRAADGADPKQSAQEGRLPQQALIDEVEAAGFKLIAKSELNANPKDTRDQPAGVWTLPPTLRLGDTDRDKYLAIGESDRMTLKFKRVNAPAKKAAPKADKAPAGKAPADKAADEAPADEAPAGKAPAGKAPAGKAPAGKAVPSTPAKAGPKAPTPAAPAQPAPAAGPAPAPAPAPAP